MNFLHDTCAPQKKTHVTYGKLFVISKEQYFVWNEKFLNKGYKEGVVSISIYISKNCLKSV